MLCAGMLFRRFTGGPLAVGQANRGLPSAAAASGRIDRAGPPRRGPSAFFRPLPWPLSVRRQAGAIAWALNQPLLLWLFAGKFDPKRTAARSWSKLQPPRSPSAVLVLVGAGA